MVSQILTAGEGVQQRGVRGGCWGRTLLFGFADLGVTFSKLQPNRLRDVRIESHTLQTHDVTDRPPNTDEDEGAPTTKNSNQGRKDVNKSNQIKIFKT